MMNLESPAFRHNGRIPSRYTCDGDNVNPALVIHDVPEGTQSLALIVEDPDVPKHVRSDGMWNHWILYNIEPDIKEIGEAEDPPGVTGAGTHGGSEYYGPCPPDREHRYFFKLFALDKILNHKPGLKKIELDKSMEGHIIEQFELI